VPGNLYTIAGSGTRKSRSLKLGLQSMTGLSPPIADARWSPNSRWIAAEWRSDAAPAAPLPANRRYRITLADPANARQRTVLSVPPDEYLDPGIAWSHDSHNIYFALIPY
jgi:hypothetical protein